MVGLIFFFIALIFIYLARKKRTAKIEKSIKKSIELWISRILLEEVDAETGEENVHIPLKFQHHFKNKTKRRFTVNQLIVIKKNLTGDIIDNITHFYEHAGFKKDSLKKFKSNIWYKKVRGIHELYMMDQKDMIDAIYKLTNSRNEYVRMEAQTAMIHFEGFDGLKFLEDVTHPITEWEQLKLLEQLKTLDFVEMNDLPKWLNSSNASVVLFALKLVDVYQQYQVHDEVVKCLDHENEKVRMQAVTTLGRIAEERTAAILAEHYTKEHFRNKQNILNCLLNIASDSETGFLVEQLNDENNSVKLSAARVIAKCCTNGFQILKDKAKQYPDPYQEIYFHLKKELQL